MGARKGATNRHPEISTIDGKDNTMGLSRDASKPIDLVHLIVFGFARD
jgi:hypothetical protein